MGNFKGKVLEIFLFFYDPPYSSHLVAIYVSPNLFVAQ